MRALKPGVCRLSPSEKWPEITFFASPGPGSAVFPQCFPQVWKSWGRNRSVAPHVSLPPAGKPATVTPQIPKPKSQNPNSAFAKRQSIDHRLGFGIWDLGFDWTSIKNSAARQARGRFRNDRLSDGRLS